MDANLILKASAAITTTTTGTSVDFGQGGDLIKLVYEVVVSVMTGTSPVLTIEIQDSDDDSTFQTLVKFPAISATGVYYRSAISNKRYRRIYATTAGTSPSFTTAVNVVPAGRYDNY